MSTDTREIRRSRTAMARNFLSRPVQRAIEDDVIRTETSVFDYGCGRGGDIKRLASMGFETHGWDPAHAPSASRRSADVVNIGYVVNVIEDPIERVAALTEAWSLANETLVVSARLDWEARGLNAEAHNDGIITDHDTFQKFYRQEELRGWIDVTLGVQSIAAAPGVFYVFREPRSEQRLLAHRSRGGFHRAAAAELWYRQHAETLTPLESFVEAEKRLPNPTEIDSADLIIEEFGSIRSAFHVIRRATPADRWVGVQLPPGRKSERRFEENLPILTPLLDFLSDRGRLPRIDELDNSDAVEEEFGSIRGAYSLIRRVTGESHWVESEHRARYDTLVYLALAAFGGRPKLRDLPDDTQYDIKDFFGSYKAAQQRADALLFATGDLSQIADTASAVDFGKHTPEAYYVHVSALNSLPPLLRIYEGCARTLTGEVDNATILKMHKLKPQVSYLIYPKFDRDPHPALLGSIVSRLGRIHVDYRSFADSENPPILHRKELFVSPDYPGRAKFERLTAAEERHGLLSDPTIGTKRGWANALNNAGFTMAGHRLVTLPSTRADSDD